MREQTNYNKVVNFDKETNEITVLDYVFKHNDGFKGATGSIFEPLTEEQIQEVIGDYEGDDKELLIYMAENFGSLNREMIENVDSSRDALLELFFDLSYSEQWDDIREQTGLSEEEAVIFNCMGGGRCFDSDFEGNINTELSKIIREYETQDN